MNRLLSGRSSTAWATAGSEKLGQPDPVEDRRGGAAGRQPVKAMQGMDKGAHRSDPAPAVHTVPCVAVQAAAGAVVQIPLDVVREMTLRPLVVVGITHHASPRTPPSCS